MPRFERNTFMKKKSISVLNCLPLLLAVLLAVGVKTFFGPCVHEDGSFGVCHWAGQVLLGLGVVMSVQALCAVLIQKPGVRAGIYLSMLFSAALSIFTPGTLIILCSMPSMRCRALMQPASIILSCLILLFSLINLIVEWKKKQ